MPPPQTQWAKRAVDQRAPQDHEHDHRAELHPLGKGPADQRRRDDEEHALEEHVGQHGDRQAGIQGHDGLAVVPRRHRTLHEQVRRRRRSTARLPPKASV